MLLNFGNKKFAFTLTEIRNFISALLSAVIVCGGSAKTLVSLIRFKNGEARADAIAAMARVIYALDLPLKRTFLFDYIVARRIALPPQYQDANGEGWKIIKESFLRKVTELSQAMQNFLLWELDARVKQPTGLIVVDLHKSYDFENDTSFPLSRLFDWQASPFMTVEEIAFFVKDLLQKRTLGQRPAVYFFYSKTIIDRNQRVCIIVIKINQHNEPLAYLMALDESDFFFRDNTNYHIVVPSK